MKLINACMAMLIAVVLLSCNTGNRESSADNKASGHDVTMVNAEKQEEKNKSQSADSAGSSSATSQQPEDVLNNGTPASSPDWDKKIIKTADVRLELKEYASYNTSLHKGLKNYGAYIANEEQTQSEDGIENTMSIKVPVDKFEELMNTFTGDGIKIIQRKISTTDVTGEVVDTKGRIEAKKLARDKYLELLKQAKNMKEILEVQNEINSIQEDLESAGGRVNYLVHEAAYSTINLTYYQSDSPGNYKGEPGFFEKLQQAFKNGSSIISGLLLFIVTIWPVLLAVTLGWFIIKKWKTSYKTAKKV